MRRDGIDKESAQKRLSTQKNDDELRSLCSAVIVNDGDDEALDADIKAFVSSLT
jgi:dephospho-CoA kinase